MKRLLFIWAICIQVWVGNSQNIRYVKPVSSGIGDGSSWANASADLQAMMNSLAPTGGQVWVAQGTYKPTQKTAITNILGEFTTDRYKSFILIKDVQVYGGFQGLTTDTSLDQRILPSISGGGSILSGDIGIPNDSTDNSYHVVVSAGEMGNACLNGFTVTKGNADGNNSTEANYLNGEIIYNNSGGGLHLNNSSPQLANLSIINNYSYSYTGIRLYISSSLLMNIIVINNTSRLGTAGIRISGNPILINVLAANNISLDSNSYIGNIIITTSSVSAPFLTNITVSNNYGKTGYAISSAIPFNLYNSIVWCNYTDSIAAGQSPNIYSTSTVNYYNCLVGGVTAPGVILDEDPLFVDPANGDFRLQPISPAINRGTNSVFHPDSLPDLSFITTDLDGNPRINCVADLGAYEFQGNRKIEKPIQSYSVRYPCLGDSTELVFNLEGVAPWRIVYTTDDGLSTQTIENITATPFHLKIYTEDTVFVKLISLQDANCVIDAQDSVEIRVIPTPKFTNIFTSDTLCHQNKTKAVDFKGFFTEYEWEVTNNNIDSLPQGIQINNYGNQTLINNTSNPITANIRFTPYYRSGLVECMGIADSFSITVLPEPILKTVLKNDTLCSGERTQPINFMGQPANLYQWTNTGTAITGIPAGVQNGHFSSYTIENKTAYSQEATIKVTPQYTLGNKICSGEADNFKILVYPQTQIQSITRNKSIFCEEEQLELQVEATGGELNYQWYQNNNRLAGAISKQYIIPMVSRGDKGIYYVEVSGRCETEKSKSINIEVSSDKMLVEKWDDVILVDNSTNEYTGYQWYKDNQIISGATEQFYQEIGGLNGCYSVELTLTNGQKERSCERCVEKATKAISIYPNPAKQGEIIYIQSEEAIESILIHSIDGKLLKKHTTGISHFPAAGLNQGIYLLTIKLKKGGIYVFKCIIF